MIQGLRISGTGGVRVLEVKPGVTGLWQVSGRSRTSFDRYGPAHLRYSQSWVTVARPQDSGATPRASSTGGWGLLTSGRAQRTRDRP